MKLTPVFPIIFVVGIMGRRGALEKRVMSLWRLVAEYITVFSAKRLWRQDTSSTMA